MKTIINSLTLTALYIILLPGTMLPGNARFTIENHANLDTLQTKFQKVTVIFWNLENLYDPVNDSATLDDEFTREGDKHWSWSRFTRKINQTAKTLLAAGGWQIPAIIGVCEAENKMVLQRLIHDTPLSRYPYQITHFDSPDRRGVDVALISRKDLFKVVDSRNYRIRFTEDTSLRTRDILGVTGVIGDTDTLTVFVNHWPSRRGGQMSSQPRRAFVAEVLKELTDSVIAAYQGNANILLMGDFNDEPHDSSLLHHLGALSDTGTAPSYSSLYNLMGIRNQNRREGTLKYRDQWSTFDQFIVSGTLMKGMKELCVRAEATSVFYGSFLLEDDPVYFGKKLHRTYSGPRYKGGFSDHLPIVTHLEIIGRLNPDKKESNLQDQTPAMNVPQ